MVGGMSPRRILAVVVLGAAVTASGATAASSGSSAAKADCSAQKRILKKAPKGSKRTAAKRGLKRCEAVTTANKRALKVVRGSHLVGTRGSGSQEDWTFCANGKYSVATTSDGSTGRSEGKRWRTADATYKSAGTFTVVIEDPKEGLSVGVARKRGKWMVATARSFGELENLGPAVRTAATTC